MNQTLVKLLARHTEVSMPNFPVMFNLQLLSDMRKAVQSVEAPVVACIFGSRVWGMLVSDPAIADLIEPVTNSETVQNGYFGNVIAIDLYSDCFEGPEQRQLAPETLIMVGMTGTGEIQSMVGCSVYADTRRIRGQMGLKHMALFDDLDRLVQHFKRERPELFSVSGGANRNSSRRPHQHTARGEAATTHVFSTNAEALQPVTERARCVANGNDNSSGVVSQSKEEPVAYGADGSSSSAGCGD